MKNRDKDDAALEPENFPLGLKGLVFDIDGVLFDSRASNMAYYNTIRKAVDLPVLSQEEEDFCHMASVQEALDAIIPRNLRPAAYEACHNINYMKEILPMLRLEPDLTALLSRLKGIGFPCAIFTNRSTSVLELLRHFDLDGFFSPLKTAATGRPKPYPDGLLEILDEWGLEPEQIAFLGDSRVDQLAAEAAGVPFWAYRNPDLKANLHVSSFAKLSQVISPLVEG